MKKIFLTAIFLLGINCIFAQGNLQFNRVISESYILNCNQNSPLNTIPIGKVWKIESIISDQHYSIEIDNKKVFININMCVPIVFPIWLTAGNTFRLNSANSPNCPVNIHFSILEFNVVQ